jgi:hypothetical protein
MSLIRSVVISIVMVVLASAAVAQTKPKTLGIDRVIDAHENAIAALRAACNTQACEQVATDGDKMVTTARQHRAAKTMTREEAYAYLAAAKKHTAEIMKVLMNNAEGVSDLRRRSLHPAVYYGGARLVRVQTLTPCQVCDQLYKVAVGICAAYINPVARSICLIAATYGYMNCVQQNCGGGGGSGGGSNTPGDCNNDVFPPPDCPPEDQTL